MEYNKRTKIPLSAKEYRKICSEINNEYNVRYEGKKICVHTSFAPNGVVYHYWFENHGFDDYLFFNKIIDNH